MAWFRGVGFILGGVGLSLFVGAFAYAFLSPPDASCAGNLVCQKDAYDRLLGRIVFIWASGLVLLAAGVVMLLLHLRLGRGPPEPVTARRVAVTPSAPGTAQARPPRK
jgi:hypothetical protein